MIVAGDGDVHGVAEKNLDQITHMRMVAVILTRADQRMMPIGERALGAIRSQVLAQPLFLLFAPGRRVDVAVER